MADTIYAESDGYIYGQNADYATARSTSAGSNDDEATSTVFIVGQVSGTYEVCRSYLRFDLAALAGKRATAAKLYLKCVTDADTTTFTLRAYVRAWTHRIGTAREANYDLTGGALAGSATSDNWTDGNYYGFDITPSLLNTGAYVYFMLVSSRDEAATQPGGSEYLGFASLCNAGTDNDPYLEITSVDVNATTGCAMV